MQILRPLDGSFSSQVFLVEHEGKQWVLKKDDPDWVYREQEFFRLLEKAGLPHLKTLKLDNLEPGTLLLEYIPGSPTMDGDHGLERYHQWGKLTRQIHEINFYDARYFLEDGSRPELEWGSFLQDCWNTAEAKATEHNFYGFTDKERRQIKSFVSPLFIQTPQEYSLLHGDPHGNNVLIRDDELYYFDSSGYMLSGDPAWDLAIICLNYPGAFVAIQEEEYANDTERLNAFMEGYGRQFAEDPVVRQHIVLLGYKRLYTPFSKWYKEVIEVLLK